MEVKRRIFKELLEKTVIPEDTPYNDREQLLKPLIEYAHDITPPKIIQISRLFRNAI